MNRPRAEALSLAAVDPLQAQRFAESIKRFRFGFDRFDDPLLYPGAKVAPSRTALFFFFIVAIDHRTSFNGKLYRGTVNGIELTGAELMYALAVRRFEKDGSFFSAEKMSRVTREEITNLFRVTEPEPIDIIGAEERAALLRDCGSKLLRYYGGSAQKMTSISRGYLTHPDGTGFLQLLERFDAYKDPLRKKPFLLVKFMERRNLLHLKDPENLHVPVDNVLQRLALRTGIVKLTSRDLENKIRSGSQVGPVEEESIRRATMAAFDEVSKKSSLSAAYLDDILWEFGRVHCSVFVPLCDRLPELESRRPYRIIKSGPVGQCPFGRGCKSYRDAAGWRLKEPNFETTFY